MRNGSIIMQFVVTGRRVGDGREKGPFPDGVLAVWGAICPSLETVEIQDKFKVAEELQEVLP